MHETKFGSEDIPNGPEAKHSAKNLASLPSTPDVWAPKHAPLLISHPNKQSRMRPDVGKRGSFQASLLSHDEKHVHTHTHVHTNCISIAMFRAIASFMALPDFSGQPHITNLGEGIS